MRLVAILIFGFLATSSLVAQKMDFVKWTAELDKEKSELILTANMEDDWVIYSQHTDPEGPIPSSFEFVELDGAQLEGEVIEVTQPIKEMSEMFEVEVIKFKKKALFKQKVKLNSKQGKLICHVTYMTCDSKRCLPPTTIPLEVSF